VVSVAVTTVPPLMRVLMASISFRPWPWFSAVLGACVPGIIRPRSAAGKPCVGRREAILNR